MMHPDLEQLVALEEATEWNASATIAHIAACADCQQLFADLQAVATLRSTSEPDAELGERVSRSLRALRPSPKRSSLIDRTSVGVFVLASLAAWVVLVLTSSLRLTASAPGADALAFSALAGLAATWYVARHTFTTTSRH